MSSPPQQSGGSGADPDARTVEQPATPEHTGVDAPPTAQPHGRESARPRFDRGDFIGRYVVLERLAVGGMGIVYAAYDPELDRRLAVKILRPRASETDGSGGATARLIREAQALAKLSHPNVIAVYDVGPLDDEVFVAMELVEGETFKQWQRRQSRPWREVVRRYAAAGEGLVSAHAAGLVHRDFKPENVLIGNDGRVRVVDFGLARPADGLHSSSGVLTDEPAPGEATPGSGAGSGAGSGSGKAALSRSLTATGTVMGTPAYMAPEQHGGHTADERSDQFSFCVALYEGLYADRPFPGKTAEELYQAIADGRVREPPRGARVPGWLRKVVLRGLCPDPDARYRSMRALLDALASDPALRWRRRALAALGAAAIGLGLVGYQHVIDERNMLCQGGMHKLVGVWDDGRQKSIHASFLATGRPFAADAWDRTRGALTDHVEDWADRHRDACEATRLRGEQSEELMDLKVQCLDRRLDDLRALTDLMLEADAKLVERSLEAVHALPALDRCDDARALRAEVPPPGDARTQAEVAALRPILASGRALRSAGKFAQGIEIMTPAARRASETGYAPLEAEIGLVLGQLQNDAGDAKLGKQTLREAVLRAEAGRADDVRLRIYGRLIYVLGYKLNDFAGATEAADHAQALLERIDAGPLQRANVLNPMGAAHQAAGKLPEAERLYRDALALREANLPADHHDVAASLNNLANALLYQQRNDEALPLLERSLAITTATLGGDHPSTANATTNVGIVLGYLGRHDEAIETHERAREIAESAWGPKHPTLGFIHNNLGVELERTSRYDEALASFGRAAEIMEPSNELRSAQITANMGNVLLLQGKPEAALAKFEAALVVMERSLSGDHPDLVNPLSGKGQALLAMDEIVESIAVLERALRIQLASPRELELAEIKLALGRALWNGGDNRKRAWQMVEEARITYLADRQDSAKRWLAEIDAWQASRKQP